MSVLLSAESARVKALDFHPVKPHVITALHNGAVQVWNYESGQLAVEFNVSDKPLRAIKYIASESLILTGGDAKALQFLDEETKTARSVLISGSEDGTIRFINSITYGLEGELKENQFKRVWSVASKDSHNLVAFGFDGGVVVTKLKSTDSLARLSISEFSSVL
ncbi:WD40-repeat-containing domain protein [Obelidium mucronatum]|nr:WD40-repeat-containing domain protein [Obelidium mucronatum]